MNPAPDQRKIQRDILARKMRMESSLRRSSKLGKEVLEKAKRRYTLCVRQSSRPGDMSGCESDHSTLDQAFAALVKSMSEVTRHCKMYYDSVYPVPPHEREHVRRFHSRISSPSEVQRQEVPSELEDFRVEIPPGTYSITASMQDCRPQSRMLHIDAGESKSFTFNL